MNIGSLFSRHAIYRPNHLAVVFNDFRLTYFEFNREINRIANALLALGVKKGREGRHTPSQLHGAFGSLLGQRKNRGCGGADKHTAAGEGCSFPAQRRRCRDTGDEFRVSPMPLSP